MFNNSKISIISSPILSRYDTDNPTFINTDWSAERMGWILMQPDNDEESQVVTKTLSWWSLFI